MLARVGTLLDLLTEQSLRLEPPAVDQALALLATPDDDILDVVAAAFRVRREFFGKRVKLNTLINAAISSPEIHDRLVNEFALTAKPLTLEQCAAQDREERAKWAEYVKIAHIEAQ